VSAPTPEEAARLAEERAAAAREHGGYAEAPPSFEVSPASEIGDWRITEWAMIEPDPAKAYSTRRAGTPITWLKRGLLRLLRQYNDDLAGQQSRFNAHMAAHVMRLDERVRELEQQLEAERRGT
jgi:hypothetical protein